MSSPSAVTAVSRASAWNIRFVEPAPDNRCVAGTFQPRRADGPLFLTWSQLFRDLLLCFDLPMSPAAGPHDRVLALWLRQKSAAAAVAPCIYFPPYQSEQQQQLGGVYIDVEQLVPMDEAVMGDTDDDDDDDDGGDGDSRDRGAEGDEARAAMSHLDLTVVVHARDCLLMIERDLEAHLAAGCALHYRLAKNPDLRYVPIPSSSGGGGGGGGAGASTTTTNASSTSASTPTAKRQRTSTSASRSPDKDKAPTPKYPSAPDLEYNTKIAYKGTCAITLTNTSWPASGSTCGPAMQACHIVPKALSAWYPHNDINPSGLTLWNRANSSENCMLMDATTHAIFDLRLVAVHPDSKRIRVFAPIRHLLPRSRRKARLPLNAAPSLLALRWHYDACVVENMCALMLDAEGGAKRMPWRDGPVLVRVVPDVADLNSPPPPPPLQLPPAEAGPPDAPTDVPGLKRKFADCAGVGADVDMGARIPDAEVIQLHSPGVEPSEEDKWMFTQLLHTRLSEEATRRRNREVFCVPWVPVPVPGSGSGVVVGGEGRRIGRQWGEVVTG